MTSANQNQSFITDKGELSGEVIFLVGVEKTAQWLHTWLLGEPATLAKMPRRYEHPYEPILRFIKQTPPESPGFQTLERAIGQNCRALEHYQSRSSEGQFHNYFSQLFRLCDYFSILKIRGFLRRELQLLANDVQAFEQKWHAQDTRNGIALLCARRLKIASVEDANTTLYRLWSSVADLPKYSRFSLIAFGGSITKAIPVLPSWWKHAAKKPQPHILRDLLESDINRNLSPDYWNKILRKLPPDLAKAIDEAYSNLSGGHHLGTLSDLWHLSSDIDSLETSLHVIAALFPNKSQLSNQIKLITSDFGKNENIFRDIILQITFFLRKHFGKQWRSANDRNLNYLGRTNLKYLYPIIVGYPFYLTQEKASDGFRVLPFAKHRYMGALFHRNSVISDCFDEEGTIPLKTVLAGVDEWEDAEVLSLNRYAMEEIISSEVTQMAIDGEIESEISLLDRCNVTQPPREGYFPKALLEDQIFIFDLGDLALVEKQIEDNPSDYKDLEFRKVSHRQDIDVGIGINGIMAQKLLENDLWKVLYESLMDTIKKQSTDSEHEGRRPEQVFEDYGYVPLVIKKTGSTTEGNNVVRLRGSAA